jgi:hypothetical protein
MSVSDLNHFMTYVIEGWMLFSAGFISTSFVSFVLRRVQEDAEAAKLALAEAETLTLSATVAEPIALAPVVEIDEAEAARLEEVAAVSEQLAKNKEKQSSSGSVSVST